MHGLWEIVEGPDEHNMIHQVSQPEEQHIYSPSDIRWIKNIANSEIGKAYLGITEETFILHFPTHHKGNALNPAIAEIILLYQRINGVLVFIQ